MTFMKFFICNCLILILLVVQANGKIKIDLGQQFNNFFEGDIKLPKTRNGILSSQKWTNGIIYYEFRDTRSQSYLDILAKAMKEIEDHTCIKFKPRVNEKNYVRIINSSYGCNSEGVGMVGNRQDLSLVDSSLGTCWFHGVLVHELLHVVGLWHEQSRYDRDDYVTIKWDNVQRYAEHNFNITFQNESYTYGLPYDYLSVMHYAKTAFGNKKGAVTIETKDPSMANRIGQEEGGSENDYEKVRRIYGCPGSYPIRPTPTTTLPTTTLAPQCEDKITYCQQQLDACKKETWPKEHCRKSCGYCSSDCKDTIDYCDQYADSCATEAWMKDYCKKTCKFCEPY